MSDRLERCAGDGFWLCSMNGSWMSRSLRSNLVVALFDAPEETVGADRTTVTGYIRLLADLFLVQQLPAWGQSCVRERPSSPRCTWLTRGWLLG